MSGKERAPAATSDSDRGMETVSDVERSAGEGGGGAFERLPGELVALVLDQLEVCDALRAARVCRRWRALLRGARLVRRRGAERRVRGGTARLLVTARGARLLAVLGAAPNLRELTVHARVPLGARELAALAGLPALRLLDVFTRDRVLDARIVPTARRLHTFVINETVAPGVLRSLADGALRELHMYGRARYFPPRELGALLAARAPHLRALTLRCAELPDTLYAALPAATRLRELRLYSCWLLTGAGAAALARLPALRVLHVSGARLLRPTALHVVLRALPAGLQELALSAGWFGDEHLASLLARAPPLRVLELWRCGLAAGGVRALAAGLPRLEELDVDAALQPADVAELARHPALLRLRCGGPGAGGAAGGLQLRAAAARLPPGALRGGGEGARAELFYRWAAPRPLPPGAPPPALSDSDEDYSLLEDIAPRRAATDSDDSDA